MCLHVKRYKVLPSGLFKKKNARSYNKQTSFINHLVKLCVNVFIYTQLKKNK